MKTHLKTILIVLALLCSVAAFAEDENEDPDAVPPDPSEAVPITDYIPLLVLGALGLGFQLLRPAAKPINALEEKEQQQ